MLAGLTGFGIIMLVASGTLVLFPPSKEYIYREYPAASSKGYRKITLLFELISNDIELVSYCDPSKLWTHSFERALFSPVR